jgi:sterol desaturase/sphingolipid hydroxylase (fatty acid hydroxylase superfamily)
VYLPPTFERVLRWVLVTPEMHRVHHSWYPEETNSNFSFHLSVWDHVFRSYRHEPRDGHTDMTIGLSDFRSDREQTFLSLLLNPFRTDAPARE